MKVITVSAVAAMLAGALLSGFLINRNAVYVLGGSTIWKPVKA